MALQHHQSPSEPASRVSRLRDYNKKALDKLSGMKIENLIVQKDLHDNTLELDKLNKIVRVRWSGNVDLETAKELLEAVDESIEYHGYSRLMIDHAKLEDFSTDARIWIKDFLKERVKILARKTSKMAVINAQSSRGSIFANMLTSTIHSIAPHLEEARSFDSFEDGIKWLLD